MDNRIGIDLGDPFQDAVAEFFPGLHADVPQEGARHLPKEGFHDIQSRSVLGRQNVFESIRTRGQVSLCLFGNMG